MLIGHPSPSFAHQYKLHPSPHTARPFDKPDHLGSHTTQPLSTNTHKVPAVAVMAQQALSTWNQAASRVYVRQWYCFPLRRDADLDALTRHLRLALDRLSSALPHLAGKVSLLSEPRGHVCLNLEPHARIPLDVLDQREDFGWTYAELKAQGFPAKAFVHPSYDMPCQLTEGHAGLPALVIQARILDGGLLLCFYNHHSISDGRGIFECIGTLAQLTRDPASIIEGKNSDNIHIDLPAQVTAKLDQERPPQTFHQLLGQCPEFILLPSATGPTSCLMKPAGTPLDNIEKTGRIFVIESQQIKSLQHQLSRTQHYKDAGRPPSTFACLAAMTWTHVTKARLSSPAKYYPVAPAMNATPGPSHRARLMLCVDWRSRAFTNIMEPSTGNAVTVPMATVDTPTILEACDGQEEDRYEALGAVIRAMNAAINGVNENSIATRTALFRASPDPRLLGLDPDPRDPTEFCFNTWRHFGADTRWAIPGLDIGEEGKTDEGIRPDAIRRIQPRWNMGAALLMPGRAESTKFEVLVTLDVESMALLCQDEEWMGWVDRVIE